MPNKKSIILKETALVSIIRALEVVVKFALNIVIARLLGPSGTGLFYIGFSLSNIAAVLTRLGLETTSLKRISIYSSQGDEQNLSKVLINGGIIVLITSSLISLATILSADLISNYLFKKPESSNSISILAIGITPLALIVFLAWSIRGVGNIVFSQFLMSLSWPMIALPIILTFTKTIEGVAICVTLSYFLTLIIGIAFVKSKIGISLKNGTSDLKEIKELYRQSKTFHIINLVDVAIQWAPPIILGIIASVIEVGYYSIASRVAYFVLFGTLAINAILAPRFARASQNNDKIIVKKLYYKGSVITGLFGSIIGVLIITFSDEILNEFGAGFTGAQDTLTYITIGYIMLSISGPWGVLLNMSGKQSSNKRISLITMFIMFASIYVGGTISGSEGAAIGFSIAITFQTILGTLAVRSYFSSNN